MIIQKIKATCTLTAAALFVSTIPINGLMLSADAAVVASGKCGSNLTWSVDDEANLTISGTGAMYDYYVSEMPWNGETFYNVIIENGVTSIGDYAFCNQYTVTNVSIPSTVTNIGTHAFSDCDDLNSIVIPDGVKTIERSAFSSCDDLSFVYIGKSVASIGDAVFSGSNMGVYVYIRSTDCTISTHEDTFSGVNMIYGISGSTAEDRAEALGIEFRIMDLTVPEGYMYVTGLCGDNLRWKADSEGLLEISGTGAMYDYTYEGGSPWRSLGITTLQLNEGMTSIGEYAFMHTDITEVSIPESAVSIGAGAFRECRSLVTAHTGKNVIFIDSMAFYSDYAMESITIEHPVCEIYDAKYTIQAPVIYGYTGSTAETYAAAYERTFISLDVPATTTTDSNIVASGECGTSLTWVLDSDGLMTISGEGEMEDYFTGYNAPWYKYRDSITNVVIENGASSIGYSAFSDLNNMVSIAIPDSVMIIEDTAFMHCNSLVAVNIPDSLESIENYAFYGCNSLTVVEIPASITNIGVGAFCYCESLKSIVVDDQNEYYSSINGVLFNKNQTTLMQYPSVYDFVNYTVPDSVTKIDQQAFYWCRALTSVDIPDSVTEIGQGAFDNCYINSITIKNPNCEIPDSENTIYLSAVIYGYTGSTAEDYANIYGRSFIPLDGGTTVTTTTTASTTTTVSTTTTKLTTTTSLTSMTTATTTTTTTTTKSDGSIEWGADNWNFLNSRTYFPHKNYYMKQSYLDVLRKNLTNTEWYYVQDWMSSSWGGSCYGMSSLTLLSNAGYLTYSDWTKGAQCLNDLETPAQNEDIESLINYYQQLQIKNAIQQQYRTVPYRGNQTNIEDIISHLEKGAPVLLGFQKSGWGGHAIVAYDIGYGSWTWNGVTYQGKIDILDPNCSMEYDERYCIYFNTSSYNWAIPAYNGMTSASGAVFNYVGNDLSVINSGGYISGSANNNTESYIARMEASEIAENHSVQKVQRNGSSFNNMNAGPDDIVPDTFYVAGGESDGVFGYVLKDSESGYSVSQSSPVPMKLRMDYEECVLEAYSAAGSGITFDKSGYASVKGESASYEIQMVFNEGNYVTDWYAIEISGANADEIIFEQTEYGYVLVGNNLQDVNVSAWNDEHDADVTFSSEYTQVLIHEIDEDTMGISADTDGDGTYETIIAESEEDNTATGDVNGDGTVNISDATLVLTLYASDAAGIVIDGVTEEQRLAADINGDGSVTISDATAILTYYSETAAGLDPSWEDIIGA